MAGYEIPSDALDMAEAAKLLDRNFYTFRANYKRLGVPHTWIGGRLCYFPDELIAWDRQNSHLMPRKGKEVA